MDKERGDGKKKQLGEFDLSFQNANFISIFHFWSMDKERKISWIRREVT